jgi:outer membrane protein
MNKLITMVGLLMAAVAAQAQNYSLQQCIDYALQNQATYKNSSLDVEIAKAKVGEVRGIGLPQISASGQYLYNLKVQNQFIPSSAFTSGTRSIYESFIQSSDQSLKDDGAKGLQGLNSYGEILPLGFGVAHSALGQVTVSQLLFDGSYIVGLQASKTYLSLSEKAKDISKATIIQNVKKAYLSVLVAQERIKLLDINLSRLDTNLSQLKSTNKAGFAESLDVDRLEVQFNNLKIEKQKIFNYYELGMLALKFQMGMALTESITLTENLDVYKNDFASLSNEVNYSNKPEFALLEVQKKASELELKNLRFGKLPSIAAFGNLGANYGSTKFGDLVKPSNYYSFSNVGLSLNLPIFDGTQRYYKMSAAKLKMQKSDNDIINLKNAIDMQSQTAKVNLDNNKKTLENSERNMALAKRVLNVVQKKYQAGVGSSIEVTNAESEYKEAYINYYTTLYDCLINKVDYDYAIGNLK